MIRCSTHYYKFAFVDGYLDMKAENLQKGKRKRDAVSVREYYCYKLQMRNDDEDEILHTGRLLQQYSVDEYIKLENPRLDFVSFNQDLFRMSILQGLVDILRLGERDTSNVGKQTFLPNETHSPTLYGCHCISAAFWKA